MLWLTGQVLLFLLIAAALGFLLGWLMRGWWMPGSDPQAVQEAAHAEAAALGQKQAAAVVKKQFASAARAKADDLKQIKGVGPVLEKLLNSMNIKTFDQVANFTPRDVAMVTAGLNAFKGRIARDDWIGQAKKLADAKRATE
jgi:predicted flap endonuclease-1-like 5' DNA nuclease